MRTIRGRRLQEAKLGYDFNPIRRRTMARVHDVESFFYRDVIGTGDGKDDWGLPHFMRRYKKPTGFSISHPCRPPTFISPSKNKNILLQPLMILKPLIKLPRGSSPLERLCESPATGPTEQIGLDTGTGGWEAVLTGARASWRQTWVDLPSGPGPARTQRARFEWVATIIPNN